MSLACSLTSRPWLSLTTNRFRLRVIIYSRLRWASTSPTVLSDYTDSSSLCVRAPLSDTSFTRRQFSLKKLLTLSSLTGFIYYEGRFSNHRQTVSLVKSVSWEMDSVRLVIRTEFYRVPLHTSIYVAGLFRRLSHSYSSFSKVVFESNTFSTRRSRTPLLLSRIT